MIAGFKTCPNCGTMCEKVYSLLVDKEFDYCDNCKEFRD